MGALDPLWPRHHADHLARRHQLVGCHEAGEPGPMRAAKERIAGALPRLFRPPRPFEMEYLRSDIALPFVMSR